MREYKNTQLTLPDVLEALDLDLNVWAKLSDDYYKYLHIHEDGSISQGAKIYAGELGKIVYSDYDPHRTVSIRFYEKEYIKDKLFYNPVLTVCVNNIKAFKKILIYEDSSSGYA